MARKLTYIPNRVIDTNGISDGASIYVYATGTTTPVSIYSDEALTTPLANPYTVAAGAAVPTIYHGESGNIRVHIVENGGTVVSDDDPYQNPVTDTDLASTDAGKGSSLVAGARKAARVTDFGALGDGSTDDSAAFGLAIAAAASSGLPVYVPAGTYRISAVAASAAHFVGEGVGKSVLELATDSTATVLDIDELRIENMTVSDRGRASMDHTTNAAVYLFDATDLFHAEDCVFLTDRSVLLQTPTASAKHCIVKRCTLDRVNAPIVSEEDAMNIFTCSSGVPFVHFDSVRCGELVARSVINATYNQSSGEMDSVVAIVENCSFEYVHNSDDAAEVKTIFLQGYTSRVESNTFTDCFGRHIDILGNFTTGSAAGVFSPAIVMGNKVGYTTARDAATGSANDEAGSIYVRYGEAYIAGNILDFTNLALSSANYMAIAVRHGFKKSTVENNTIISAKAHGIEVDLSDSVDTTESAVSIVGNKVEGTRSGRLPISVSSTAATKLFTNVTIRDNDIKYGFTTAGIVLDVPTSRSVSFMAEHVNIVGNYNITFDALDHVDFQGYPESLYAPNTDVTITVNPAGVNGVGKITSLSDAVNRVETYRCKSLTVALDASVTTTQTLTGPLTLSPILPDLVTIDGDNGASGRIRFYTAGAQQSGLIVTLSGKRLVFDGCIFNSDSGTSTTALVLATGYGDIVFDTCTFQYGEYAIDTRGPNINVEGGTIDDINLGSSGSNAVFYASAENLVTISAHNTTGLNNNRLYNFASPALLIHDSISLGVTTGTKTFTVVV